MNRCSISQRYFWAPVSNFGTERKSIQQILRTEPDTNVLDIDDRAVVHLKGVFRLQFREAVGANDLEVRTNWKDRTLDALSANFAAKDRNDPPDPMTEIAGDNRRSDPDREAEDIFRLKHGPH